MQSGEATITVTLSICLSEHMKQLENKKKIFLMKFVIGEFCKNVSSHFNLHSDCTVSTTIFWGLCIYLFIFIGNQQRKINFLIPSLMLHAGSDRYYCAGFKGHWSQTMSQAPPQRSNSGKYDRIVTLCVHSMFNVSMNNKFLYIYVMENNILTWNNKWAICYAYFHYFWLGFLWPCMSCSLEMK